MLGKVVCFEMQAWIYMESRKFFYQTEEMH